MIRKNLFVSYATPLEPVSNYTLLPLHLKTLYLVFTNSSLFMTTIVIVGIVFVQFVLLFSIYFMITENGAFVMPSWKSIIAMVYAFVVTLVKEFAGRGKKYFFTILGYLVFINMILPIDGSHSIVTFFVFQTILFLLKKSWLTVLNLIKFLRSRPLEGSPFSFRGKCVLAVPPVGAVNSASSSESSESAFVDDAGYDGSVSESASSSASLAPQSGSNHMGVAPSEVDHNLMDLAHLCAATAAQQGGLEALIQEVNLEALLTVCGIARQEGGEEALRQQYRSMGLFSACKAAQQALWNTQLSVSASNDIANAGSVSKSSESAFVDDAGYDGSVSESASSTD